MQFYKNEAIDLAQHLVVIFQYFELLEMFKKDKNEKTVKWLQKKIKEKKEYVQFHHGITIRDENHPAWEVNND